MMPEAMHKQCPTHVPDALHERTDELTNADAVVAKRADLAFRTARDVRQAANGLGGWASYDWASVPEGETGRFGRYTTAGWLYVVEFSFGVVKVGRSIAPRPRIQSHIKDATRFDGTVSRFWLSNPHKEWKRNEGHLILWASDHGRQTFGEYFADLDFDDTVTYAWSLITQAGAQCATCDNHGDFPLCCQDHLFRLCPNCLRLHPTPSLAHVEAS